MSAHID